MEALPADSLDLDLRAVRVRPTRGGAEHRRWDRLVERHHYLSFQGLFGKAVRHVATVCPEWLALVGWQAAALKLSEPQPLSGVPQTGSVRRLERRGIGLWHGRWPTQALRNALERQSKCRQAQMQT